MSKKMVAWLIAATSLVVVGCVIFGGTMMLLNWDFTKLSTVKYETNEYTVEGEYQNISLVTDTAHIVLVPSETANTSVICYEQKNAKHTVTVKDGILAIEPENAKKWYEYIGVNFASPKITVSIPRREYDALSVKVSTGDVEISHDFTFKSIDIVGSTGDIRLENVSADQLNLSVSTGKVTVADATCEGDMTVRVSTGKTNLTDVHCKNLMSSGNTGNVSLKNVIATEKYAIERSTGDVKLEQCDAAELFIKTDTGDVSGSLRTGKVFEATTDTGRVKVPKGTTGGKCEIITNTGNIKIDILR